MGKVYPFLSKLADPRPLTPNRRRATYNHTRGDSPLTPCAVCAKAEHDEPTTPIRYVPPRLLRRRFDWRGAALTFALVAVATVIGVMASLSLSHLMGIS